MHIELVRFFLRMTVTSAFDAKFDVEWTSNGKFQANNDASLVFGTFISGLTHTQLDGIS